MVKISIKMSTMQEFISYISCEGKLENEKTGRCVTTISNFLRRKGLRKGQFGKYLTETQREQIYKELEANDSTQNVRRVAKLCKVSTATVHYMRDEMKYSHTLKGRVS